MEVNKQEINQAPFLDKILHLHVNVQHLLKPFFGTLIWNHVSDFY